MILRTCEFCLSWKLSSAHRGFCHCRSKAIPKGGYEEVEARHHCQKWEPKDEKTKRLVETAEKNYGGVA